MRESTNERYQGVLRDTMKTERLQYFSDAVFAIALTLLVLEITVPILAGDNPSNADITVAVAALWPKLLAYVISFVVIGVNWTGHHRKFAVMTRIDGTIIRIDLLLLFLIAFVPFPTALLSDYLGDATPVIVYAATVSAISLVQLWMWVYAYKQRYLNARIDGAMYRMIGRNLLVVPVVFVLSIPVALLPFDEAGLVAMCFWVLSIPLGVAVGRLGERQETRRRLQIRHA
ncbi:TMEM175 family protein [Subtercola endophyticus]|uniref:TMEM175 family protein n=1 Tax=Subtercola endophyticus TaxID=2895559 RepID=UPI001E5EB952|nr:TMEM175 family protein [Subtercola endophyticus]UFS60875.1 DUF1211 domain-containing protein [Subtercola endophyticus]